MPVLENPKYEKFAQGLAAGLDLNDAYVQAGYNPSPSNAHRLKNNEKVKARVTEIVSNISEKAEWDAAKRLKMLADIAERNHKVDARVTVSAIAEANKMQGSYAPAKTQIEGNIVTEIKRVIVDPKGG